MRATSVRHALDLLQEHPEATLMAGGQSVLTQKPPPRLLVDIGRLEELDQLRLEHDEIVVGPLVRLDQLARSALIQDHCPLLAHCAAGMGDPQLRHQATLGGALCDASPWAEPAPVALALDAVIALHTRAGPERVATAEFLRRTATAPSPMTGVVTEIRIPPATDRWGYVRHARRSWGRPDMIVATVQGRIVLADAPTGPVRATAAETALAATANRTRAARLVPDLITPGTARHTPHAHRRRLSEVLTDRALRQAGW
ncbi:FAD binding domain-containing protein [Kitasatospora cineracea]|uniref:FAD binding domain-containing protein n=1 Tax=Kitasatospora cineracea TaxID=88074 RepID=UPI0033D458FF